jgi:hypothetical protein
VPDDCESKGPCLHSPFTAGIDALVCHDSAIEVELQVQPYLNTATSCRLAEPIDLIGRRAYTWTADVTRDGILPSNIMLGGLWLWVQLVVRGASYSGALWRGSSSQVLSRWSPGLGCRTQRQAGAFCWCSARRSISWVNSYRRSSGRPGAAALFHNALHRPCAFLSGCSLAWRHSPLCGGSHGSSPEINDAQQNAGADWATSRARQARGRRWPAAQH